MRGFVHKKRLLHVTTVPMTLRFLRGQVGYVRARGYDIHVASSPGEELDAFALAEELPVIPVAMARRIAPHKDIVALLRLWRTIRTLRPEIVHSHTPKGGLLGMCAAALAGVPVRVYHLRGLPMMTASGSKRELLRWTERLSCGLAHEVLCVSDSLREAAEAEGLCAPEKIRVLAGGSGNGVDSEGQYTRRLHDASTRFRIRSEFGIGEDAQVVGFVGRLVRDKGIVELQRAWSRLRERFPEAHLLLVGPEESGDAVPADVAASLRSDERVHRTGLVASAAPFYAAMDLLVLPTYREGFPNVLLEAGAMELPVVATEVSGCVDAIVDGQTGTLIPPREAVALERAAARYLSSAKLRDEHGQRARRWVRENFAQERIWAALAERYDSLRSGSARSRAAAMPGQSKDTQSSARAVRW